MFTADLDGSPAVEVKPKSFTEFPLKPRDVERFYRRLREDKGLSKHTLISRFEAYTKANEKIASPEAIETMIAIAKELLGE